MEKNYPFTLFKSGESKEVKNSGEEAIARKDGFCEPYKHQEYPKMLYRDGKHTVNENAGTSSADTRTVNSKDEEAAARKDGYRGLHEAAPEAEEKPKAKKAA